MGFVPIRLQDYVRSYLKSNRGSKEADPSEDYEIAEAAHHRTAIRGPLPAKKSSTTFDEKTTDDELPF